MQIDRRRVLMGAASASLLPAAIARAAAIDAHVRTGTIKDVEHVVILTQENRSFDHYFGGLAGVRGFGDRFPIPVADTPGLAGKTVWTQVNSTDKGGPPLISPFPLNTAQTFSHMRVEGTPHNWFDAQAAWDEGRMSRWPIAKSEHAMGYFQRADMPFQYALAETFTLCDAYHCGIQSSTNPNRLFIWTATNDPSGTRGGPAITNSHDRFVAQGGDPDSYRWTVYVERLHAAGISWRIYQDMADNFTDNPTAGFRTFRDSHDKAPGSDPRLAEFGLSTWALDGLKKDVETGKLPQVSYIVAGQKDSEHPGPSSPAQGADFTARVLDILTSDPKVWAKTVLLLNFDENDGFFDHAPPPSAPSVHEGRVLGGSTVDTTGEYHLARAKSEEKAERDTFNGRPYGPGARVPMYVVSPWSRGGWVDSQVFDHTSVIRFLEARFEVMEPNITAFRREVCGDLTSAFNFKTPNDAPFARALPDTKVQAQRAAALPGRTTPPTPASPLVPVQDKGVRLSRALPYALRIEAAARDGAIRLAFHNDGRQGAVLHVYDRRHLDRAPHRYMVGVGKALDGAWESGAYDLWVLGPNGFHRHFIGDASAPEPVVAARHDLGANALVLSVSNPGASPVRIAVAPKAYEASLKPWTVELRPSARAEHLWPLAATHGWYDLELRGGGAGHWLRRLAGRMETGAPSISDPAMGGPAVMDQAYPA